MAATESQRHLLIKHRVAIVQDMRVRRILDILYSQEIVTRDDCERIEAKETNADRARALLDLIPEKGYRAFRSFRLALQESYPHLAQLLKGDIDSPDSPSELQPEDDLESILPMLVEGGVPQRPNVHIKREKALETLRNGLQSLQNQEGWVILHGMGGSGKTVLAAESLRSAKLIGTCFPGGVSWLTMGKYHCLISQSMQNLCSRLDQEYQYLPTNIEAARDRLRMTIARRYAKMLLILDDVWSWRVLAAFNLRCRTLVTTRDSTIADRVGGHKVLVPLQDGFTTDQSKTILASWIKQPVESLPAEASAIIDECKSSPLAISMIGALLQRRPDRWGYYLELLKNRQVSRLRKSMSYQFDTLGEAISMSVDNLDPELRQQYEQLAVFESNVKIPASVLAILWDKDEAFVEDDMDELASKSLAKIYPRHYYDTNKMMVYGIHDLQMDFLKEQCPDLPALHRKLIERYDATCHGQYHLLKNDRYIHDNLISHLIQANEISKAKALLTDLLWLEARLTYTLPSSLLSDYIKIKKLLNDEDRELLEKFAELVSVHSHLFVENPRPDLIQMAISQTGSTTIHQQALKIARQRRQEKFYLNWCNKPSHKLDKCLMSLRIHKASAACCSFSPDGSQVVSSSWNGDIQIWDAFSGASVAKFDGHGDEVVCCCCFSKDGRIASASLDETVKVWNIANESLELVYDKHDADVLWCQFSPDQANIVSCGADRLVKLWNSRTGEDYATFYGHLDIVRQCAFSNDGQKIVSCSDDTYVKVWDTQSGDIRKDLLLALTHHDEGVSSCAFFNNDTMIISSSGRNVITSSVKDGSKLASFRCFGGVLCCNVSSSGLYFAAGLTTSALQMWHIQDRQTVAVYKGHNGWIQSVSYAPDDSRLLSSASDETVKFWSSNPTEDKFARVKLRIFFTCSFQDDEPTIYAPDMQESLLVYHGLNSKFVEEYSEGRSKIRCCCLSKDETLLSSGRENGEVMILSSIDGRLLQELNGHKDTIIFIRFIGDRKRLLSCARDNTAKVFNENMTVSMYKIDRLLQLFVAKVILYSFVYMHLLLGILWDSATGNMLYDYSHSGHLTDCSIMPDQQSFITTSVDAIAKLWSCEDGRLIRSYTAHEDCVRSCRISNDGKLLAVGCDNGSIKIWDIHSGKELMTLRGHNVWVNCCKFSKDGNYLVTVSDTLIWWDLRNGKKLQEIRLFGRYADDIFFNGDFTHFVTIDSESIVYILKRLT
ncbi:uncharacterized protein TRIADDRAFT_32738 [Trichoplax adhaerens]|uniref:CARD domain-containing protein n=1 Tax=Trichoplax adhaerens TaxID=10228 RepID=B3SBJ1_TRIAD|nr:hypothetical protein TRIADDRAFT_32738 [Trichoplax adhaerens]EDV19902.1 hypothetical protein TRIADDRAFT_32738 [Trichoplax adhaerens]|eukprot:XP_002117644.1 hypothetical protein TRIADDRAFT_32738 [Trichoplax adhaerens]